MVSFSLMMSANRNIPVFLIGKAELLHIFYPTDLKDKRNETFQYFKLPICKDAAFKKKPPVI